MKIGITGQNGFIGTHLKNFLGTKEDVSIIPFENIYFNQQENLEQFVTSCDAIIHLAALNRHNDSTILYQENISLVEKLIAACKATNSTPHILFSSSSQEDKNNPYGQSKKIGRELLEDWSKKSGAIVTGMVIPNVFGAFGKPYYNSVVATFCHQLTHGEIPTIQVDGKLKLIYVNDLIADIYRLVQTKTSGKVEIQSRYELKVSKILKILKEYKAKYLDLGEFPDISSPLRLALFNTFRCYIPKEKYPFPLKLNTDNRGNFVEIARTGSNGQFSFSTTKLGITRGNHFHTRKAERFAVIKGKASIKLRKIGTQDIIEYIIDGDNPAFVDMPIWFTHNITNIGEEDLITLFWINEPYNPKDPDTYFVNV